MINAKPFHCILTLPVEKKATQHWHTIELSAKENESIKVCCDNAK